MKKLLLLSSICFVNALHADALSDAIQNSDVEAVRTILLAGNFNTKSFSKYLHTAENITTLRRENIVGQGIKPGYCEDDPNSRKFARVGIMLMLSSPLALTLNLKPYITNGNFRKILPCMVLFAGAFCYKKGIDCAWDYLDKRHKDAIAITELLHDYFVEL